MQMEEMEAIQAIYMDDYINCTLVIILLSTNFYDLYCCSNIHKFFSNSFLSSALWMTMA